MNPNPNWSAFNSAMDKILKADPKAVKDAMKEEKQANAKKRKAKGKRPASDRASGARD